MWFWNYFPLVFGFFVYKKVTNQERTRFSTMTEWQWYQQSGHNMILIKNDYYQYLANHISGYVVHQILTPKRKIILNLMNQRVVIHICWLSWVPYYVLYARKYEYTPTLIFQSLDGCYVLLPTFAKMQKIIYIVIIWKMSTISTFFLIGLY